MNKYEGGTGPLADSIIAAAQASNGFVLELGIGTGEGSTAMIQEGLAEHPRPLHISVDWQDWLPPENRPSTPWWHLVLGDSRSRDTLFKVMTLAGGRRAGLIFIDTDHNYAQMKAELELWGYLAGRETMWLGHDSHMYGVWNADMMRAVIEYAEREGWVYDDYRQDSHGLWRMRSPQALEAQ
jgi:hypothetical protein